MKTKSILVLAIVVLCSSYSLKAQKKGDVINLEKVEYVANAKTEELDKIVHLEERHQKKNIHKIYSNYEIQKQRLIRQTNKKSYKSHNTYFRGNKKEDKDKKIKLLDKEVDMKINQQLTRKQRNKLREHKLSEKEIIQM